MFLSKMNRALLEKKNRAVFQTLFFNCIGKQFLLIRVASSALSVVTDRSVDCHTLREETLSNEGVCLSDGIRPIVQLLNSEGNEVKEVAAEALSSLTHGNQLNAQ